MGNPLNDGAAQVAPRDKFTISGNVPKEFIEALNNHKAKNKHVESINTEINFFGGKCTIPDNSVPVQAVGERRPEGKPVNWSENGFHKSSSEIDWSARKSMGMAGHPFADPKAVIPMSFRFTVETDRSTKFQHFVKDVDINWMAKTIKMSLYETTDFDTYEVVDYYTSHKCNHPLTVMIYDGMGNKIMGYLFRDVAVHTYSTPLDYASSEILTAKVLFSYKSVERLKRPTQ